MSNNTVSQSSKIAIIKLSGKSVDDFTSSEKWISLIADLYKSFTGIILVHGAGKMITEWADKLGHETVFVDGHRVTTAEMMEVVSAVQGGLINSQLVAKLNSSHLEAVGTSGIDRKSFTAAYMDERIGFVGKPELTGSVHWIEDLLAKKVIPVFSSICSDENGNLMNVNADLFTEVLAVAINADTVFFVSDVDGVIINNSIKESLTPEEIISGIKNNQITGGMVPKLKSCSALLDKGVKKIWIGSDPGNFIRGFSNGGTCIVKSLNGKTLNLKVA
jgi:acetylglutamate kinase